MLSSSMGVADAAASVVAESLMELNQFAQESASSAWGSKRFDWNGVVMPFPALVCVYAA